MPTPPTLVGFATNEALNASGVAVATASLTWQIGDVIAVITLSEGASGGEVHVTPTTTGTGIAFGASLRIHNSSATDCNGSLWAAVATANSSGTFSEAATHTSGSRDKFIGVAIFRGSAGIGNTALGTGSGRTVSLTPTGADGSILWGVGDWAAATVQAYSPVATSHGAAAPGPTAAPKSAVVTGKFTYYFGDLDDQTSAGAVGYGIGGSGTGPFTIFAIEAKAAAGGVAAAPLPALKYRAQPHAHHKGHRARYAG